MEADTTIGTETPKSSKTGNVPTTDVDFNDVLQKVTVKWQAETWLTLQYTNQEAFAEKATAYSQALETKTSKSAQRPQITANLANSEKKMDDAIKHVKGYIAEKFDADAKNYYPAFGLALNNKTYTLPKDQNSRLDALDLMIAAIAENDFNARTYGKAFWQDLRTTYQELLASASNTDGLVSMKAGDKKMLKTELKEVLNSIVNVLRGNFPKTYKEQLRDWGFQKEKY